ncbi:MAG: ABC transporter permease [Spirochaetia bacterium]
MFLPVSFIRESRVALGGNLHIWEISIPFAGVLFIILSALLLLSFIKFSKNNPLIWQITGAVLFLLPWIFIPLTGQQIDIEAAPYARAAPNTGAWLLFLACFMVFDGKKEAEYNRVIDTLIFPFLPLAIITILAFIGSFSRLSVYLEFLNRSDRVIREFFVHLGLALTAVGTAALVGIPAGFAAFRNRTAAQPIFAFVNGVQTIPSLALFGLLIAPLAFLSQNIPVVSALGIQGIGTAPAFIALTLYALLLIVRNTYAGLDTVPSSARDAGFGMGMSKRQLLFSVEFPIAVPVILTGMRTSLVQTVGNTAIAALIGAGGFGTFIFQGLGQGSDDLILLGALPVVILAVIVDRVAAWLINFLTPEDLK